MLRKLGLLAVAAILGLGLMAFAGCGDDEEPASGGSSTTESTPEATEESGGGGGGGGTDEQIQAAVDACKQTIEAQGATFSDKLKADLNEICEEAAAGDEDAVRKASKDVCVKIVEEMVPEGPGREQALAACDQAGEAP